MTDQEAASRLALTELELEVKGYASKDARAAVKRAVSYARTMSGRLPEDIRPRAFEALLDLELKGAETWLRGIIGARDRGDYARGMARAMRDGDWARSIERLTGKPAKEAEAAWIRSQDAAVSGWFKS